MLSPSPEKHALDNFQQELKLHQDFSKVVNLLNLKLPSIFLPKKDRTDYNAQNMEFKHALQIHSSVSFTLHSNIQSHNVSRHK